MDNNSLVKQSNEECTQDISGCKEEKDPIKTVDEIISIRKEESTLKEKTTNKNRRKPYHFSNYLKTLICMMRFCKSLVLSFLLQQDVVFPVVCYFLEIC